MRLAQAQKRSSAAPEDAGPSKWAVIPTSVHRTAAQGQTLTVRYPCTVSFVPPFMANESTSHGRTTSLQLLQPSLACQTSHTCHRAIP